MRRVPVRIALTLAVLVAFYACEAGRPRSGSEPPRPDVGLPGLDSGTPDAGAPDAATPDAGAPDAATPDAGTPDAATPDAGTPDAATPPPPATNVEACGADCAARFAPACGDASRAEADEALCNAQCLGTVPLLRGFCVEEYRAQVGCRGAGGYECIRGTPVPLAACSSQATAYAECAVDLPCKQTCGLAGEQGCGGASFEACIEACHAEQEAVPERCRSEFDRVLMCQTGVGAACADGRLRTPVACIETVLDFGRCVSDEVEDVCAGVCWASERLGCGEGCAASCGRDLADAACGEDYDRILRCMLVHGDAECADGRLSGVDVCANDEGRWDDCKAGCVGLDPTACRARVGCLYVAPGCDDNMPPAVPHDQTGCQPERDCALDGCPARQVCAEFTYDPCAGVPNGCAACGAITMLCVPEEDAPPP